MKTLFFSLLLILAPATFCFAQGNLQFNQVILFDLASAGIQNISVPAGKVWKIETCATYNGSSAGITIRNAAVQPIAILSTNTAASNYPYWMPSGFIGSFYNSSAGRSSISILEFNVVP